MQPSINELKTAFERTELPLAGLTFDQALNIEAVKICLNRMALNAQQLKVRSVKRIRSSFKPAREYWYDKL